MKQELFSIKDIEVVFRKIIIDAEGNKTTEEYIHPEIKVREFFQDNKYNECELFLHTTIQSNVLNEYDYFEEIELRFKGKNYNDGLNDKREFVLHNMKCINKRMKYQEFNDFYDIVYKFTGNIK